jgi:hypothetical protein
LRHGFSEAAISRFAGGPTGTTVATCPLPAAHATVMESPGAGRAATDMTTLALD